MLNISSYGDPCELTAIELCDFSEISGVSVGIRTQRYFGFRYTSTAVMAHVRPTLQPQVKCLPACRKKESALEVAVLKFNSISITRGNKKGVQ